ncbi:MAG: hypothetical protein HRT51_09035 [Colwellia sp.]|nr:hypothetical protein [Colwellia sp.]
MALPSLDTQQVRKIETLIARWQMRLTWGLLVDRIKSDLDIDTTRQTLNSYKSIYNEYCEKKQALRGKPSDEFIKFVKEDENTYKRIKKLEDNVASQEKKIEILTAYIGRIGDAAKLNPSLLALLNKMRREMSIKGG